MSVEIPVALMSVMVGGLGVAASTIAAWWTSASARRLIEKASFDATEQKRIQFLYLKDRKDKLESLLEQEKQLMSSKEAGADRSKLKEIVDKQYELMKSFDIPLPK
jgi:hypothetical protein